MDRITELAATGIDEKRIAAELTAVTLSKNPDWDASVDWLDQADYAGKMFARILRFVREELDEAAGDDEFDDDDDDDDDELDDDGEAAGDDDEDDDEEDGDEPRRKMIIR